MHGRSRGFTLIEILVVVFIIGIVLSIGVLSLDLAGDDRDLKREARRFVSLIAVAQDEAMMQGRDFGIEFLTGGYRFVEYDPVSATWFDVPQDDLLVLKTLPEELMFNLFLEDKRVLLESEPQEIPDPDEDRPASQVKNYAPHVLLFSSGDMTPFELAILRPSDNLTLNLAGDLLGNVEIETEDDANL